MSAAKLRSGARRCATANDAVGPGRRGRARDPGALRVNLVDAGYEVRAAPDAESAQRELTEALPTLLLLDWMLPGKSGLALAKELRGDARTRELPIIMLTARTDEADKVAGPRSVGRRLRDQAVLAARAEGADQGGAAAARARVGAGTARPPARSSSIPQRIA